MQLYSIDRIFFFTLYEKVIYIWQIHVFLQYFLLNILCKFYFLKSYMYFYSDFTHA